MHLVHYLSVATNLLNIAILLPLLYVFLKNYTHIKSDYNKGLIIFGSMFLLENLLSLFLGIFLWPTYAHELTITHIAVINLIQLGGLLALFYIKWR